MRIERMARTIEGSFASPVGDGWIDEGNFEKYTMDPVTDADGEVLEGAEE